MVEAGIRGSFQTSQIATHPTQKKVKSFNVLTVLLNPSIATPRVVLTSRNLLR